MLEEVDHVGRQPGIVGIEGRPIAEAAVGGDDLAFEQFVETAVFAQASADEQVVGVHLLAIGQLGACAAQADVGDLVLTAA